MVLIKKGKEPRSLTEYRSQPNSTYEGFRQKDDVRKQLLEEQGYLCAYCMRRISLNSMKIEHWKAQNAEDGTGADHALEYRNMLGVCLGNLSYPYAAQTCDTHRGNTELFVDPRTPEHIKRIEYDAHGRIYSKDERINRDLDQILNLNGQTTYLKEGRKEAIRTLQQYLLAKQPDGTWNEHLLERVRKVYMEKKDGKYEPYLGAILFFLDKYLRKAQGSHTSKST